ncbi:MAG: AAA family ATPase [Bdellovibrionota bacterium]
MKNNLIQSSTGLLSERMRPSLNTIEYLVGAAKKIWHRDFKQWLEEHKFHMILWGPPGCGKTTLARLLAEKCSLPFVTLSAVRDGVKEIRHAVENIPHGLLFIDEIHRLNKAQQDTLLPILEYSEAWVIGATTESPSTALNPALLSRIRNIYVAPLKEEDINQSLHHALEFLKRENHDFEYEQLEHEVIPKINHMSGHDLRFALNLFENIAHCKTEEEKQEIYKNTLKSFSSKNHYEYISAMIKSMRGSDPDAALFYAILMLDRGEDPLFILRRCIIFASEDIGNADPQALVLATSAYKAVEAVGMPEGRIPLSQCICYLASSAKSNKAYLAIDTVREWRVKAEEQGQSIEPPIPLTLKGKHLYKYPHDFENNFVNFQYLPESIVKIKDQEKKPAYLPSGQGFEKNFLERLAKLWTPRPRS